MCGEQTSIFVGVSGFFGSSPRVRGTGSTARSELVRQRFIPACAGNSDQGSRSRRRRSVHPRVCGEQIKSPINVPAAYGSSPRVRGTGPCLFTMRLPERTSPSMAVHPRVCGEQTVEDIDDTSQYGSSPRVRGTDRIGFRRCRYRRFIPACAGNSTSIAGTRGTNTVHPRVCGEQCCAEINMRNIVGSSPRVRGTAVTHFRHYSLIRFIPACAGNRRHAHCRI